MQLWVEVCTLLMPHHKPVCPIIQRCVRRLTADNCVVTRVPYRTHSHNLCGQILVQPPNRIQHLITLGNEMAIRKNARGPIYCVVYQTLVVR